MFLLKLFLLKKKKKWVGRRRRKRKRWSHLKNKNKSNDKNIINLKNYLRGTWLEGVKNSK